MSKKEYFLGLDLGTSSVGWAVTDTRYKLQRFNKKDMWGSRLFDEAQTAQERRLHRSSRRRIERKKKRIQLLQELFAEEIEKIDPTFFIRLKESKFHFEDKKINEKYTLFNDVNYSDKDYLEKYPTIYHLRKDLVDDNSKKDIRLVYLALHHILKYRGHFLFEGQNFSIDDAFSTIFSKLSDYLFEQFDFIISIEKYHEIETILLNKKLNLRDKSNKLASVCDTKDPQFKNILSVMIGGKRKLSVIFNNPEFDESEKKDVDFTTSTFDDEHETYEQILNEDIILLDLLKSVYDWMILSSILESHKFISHAKVESYEEHSKDLNDIKYIIRKYGKKGEMKECFNSPSVKGNYASYVNSTLNDGRKKPVAFSNQEEINNFFKKKLEKLEVQNSDLNLYNRIFSKLEDKSALPKQRTTDNSVIPYQVHKMELDMILKNASEHFDFLNQIDDTGLSTIEKIGKIMTFRIPYYIGPLNSFHSEYNNGNSWIVKKSDKEILPWNFNEIVDEEKSAERFIRRMTNKCTYLLGADVIPDDSILYEKFKVLNELNNLKIDGKPITIELKNDILKNLFMTKNKVTQKMLRTYLKRKGLDNADSVVISGIDGDFKSSLKSYNFFKDILGEKIEFNPSYMMVENIILWKCIFEADGKLLKNKIRDEYPNEFTNSEIKKITNKNFRGWGRFSREFLCEIRGFSNESGEVFDSIIDAMEKSNDNLMQILSSKYSFKDEIEKWNNVSENIEKVTYDNVMKDVYLSPAVKRSVWQAINICEEIRKIRKTPPSKIFVEMTRTNELNKDRKDSRRNNLIELYKNCKEDVSKYVKELENYNDRDLRAKALYLYYIQKGKCMYTGETIDLSLILNKKDNALSLYDIDHIYPRSLTKDDSFDNLVLVKKEINISLSDNYPIPSNIRNRMFRFWEQLKEQGFISSNKFYRLIRNTPLSTEELAGFINRQLVETGQSTKATAEILKKIYPDTEIVYTKSRVISDFRHKFGLLKCRELNNFHHAHDAFLNIVAGNAYHTKFTANPYNYIKQEKDKGNDRFYNLDKFFDRKVERNGYIAWDKELHLPFVKNTLQRSTVNVTRMPYLQKGELFNATLQRKTDEKKLLAPIKGSDERLHDISKYGGYNKIKGSYFFAVEHTLKNKRIITLEQVYIISENNIKSNKDLENYCKEVLELVEPKIIESKIKMGSKFLWGGFPLYLQSRTGNSIRMSVAKEVSLSNSNSEIFRKISKMNLNTNIKSDSFSSDISLDDLINLYDEYIDILKSGEFEKRPNNPIKILINGREKFIDLNISDKVKTIIETHKSLGRLGLSGVDLKLIGGSAQSGVINKNKDITSSNVILINESSTGLYENQKVLSKG